MRVFVCCAAGILLSPALTLGQPTGSIEISGTVTNSATGLPVPGALVALQPGQHQIPEDLNFPKEFHLPEGFNLEDAGEELSERITEKLEKLTAPDPPQRLLSDASGTFSFFVSAGTSSVTVQVKRAGFQPGKPISLRHEKMLSKTNINLIPLGAVQGRVVNQDGEPVPGVSVESIQILVRNGRKEFHNDAAYETDDLGEFRMWDLDPGLVYLRVVNRNGTSPKAADPSLRPSHVAYAPVHYPAADTQAEAQAVRIRPGETIRADFFLQEQKAYKISGVLENPGLTSIGEPWIRRLRGDDGVPVRSSLDLAKGTFEIVDVQPGSYTIQALVNSDPAMFGETTVTVREGDISGLTLPLTMAASVKGTVVFPAGGSDPDANLHYASIQAQATNAKRVLQGWSMESASTGESGKFELENLLPGNYAINVLGTSGTYVASIQSGGVDVLSDGLTVGSTAPPEIKIIFASGGGTLECTADGLDEDSVVTVAAVRRYNSTNLVTIGSIRGAYPAQFSNLAPGEYTIFAWSSTREVEYQNPSALAALSAYGVAVSIKDGSHEKVDVKLIPEDQ